MRLDGWFANEGGDELGDCCDSVFFFLGLRDDDVGIWGVGSSVASKFELRVQGFVFFGSPVKRSPLASVLGSFFVKYMKSISYWCWSFNHKFVFLWMGTPPLQMLEVEVDGNWDGGVVWVCSVISGSEGSVFAPVCGFEISFGDIAFSPSFQIV